MLEKVEAPVSGPHATVPINHCPPPVRALLISPSFHERVGKETDTRVQLRGEYNGTPPLSLLVTADTDEAVRAAEVHSAVADVAFTRVGAHRRSHEPAPKDAPTVHARRPR